MLRQAAMTTAAAVVLGGLLAPLAHAADDDSGVCKGASMYVKVCAEDTTSTPGSGGSDGKSTSGTSSAHSSDKPKCTYEKLIPQPPEDNAAVQEGKRQGGKGAVYRVVCPDTGRVGVVWIADGADPAAPAIDPEVVARQAVDAMKLVGPKIANPHPGGKYVAGMPMWMWVDETPTTFGPNTATATAGGVTVTATAKVSSIRWDMGDDSEPVVCNGPGTKYEKSMGKAPSPDCGHLYEKASTSENGEKFHGEATATWTVNWEVTGGPADAGSFTEVRQSPFTVDVREVQVLN